MTTIDEELKAYGVERRVDLGEREFSFTSGKANAFVERVWFSDGCWADVGVDSDLIAIHPEPGRLRYRQLLTQCRHHPMWCKNPKGSQAAG